MKSPNCQVVCLRTDSPKLDKSVTHKSSRQVRNYSRSKRSAVLLVKRSDLGEACCAKKGKSLPPFESKCELGPRNSRVPVAPTLRDSVGVTLVAATRLRRVALLRWSGINAICAAPPLHRPKPVGGREAPCWKGREHA